MESTRDILKSLDNAESLEVQLRCPVCGDEYAHFMTSEEIRLLKAIRDETISSYNYGVRKIYLKGESCGHYWAVCVGSHKGNIAQFIEVFNV